MGGDQTKTLEIRDIAWGPGLRAILSRIREPAHWLRWYRDQLAADCAYALGLHDGNGKLVGAMVYRFDYSADGKTFVVIAGACAPALYWQILPVIEKLAADAGCQYVRTHTDRESLVAAYGEAGYGTHEIVVRKELAA